MKPDSVLNGSRAQAVNVLEMALQDLRKQAAEIERLQNIIDSRPAINAALPESYIKWFQSLYVLDAIEAGAIKRN